MSAATLTPEEVAINEAHKARWSAAAEEFGHAYSVPWATVQNLGEQHRRDWLEYYGRDEAAQAAAAVPKRDKSKRLNQIVAARAGHTVTVDDLAAEAGCTTGTAYSYIREHPVSFRKVGMGTWLVVDFAAERAAAKAATPTTLPAAARAGEDVASTAANVEAALNALTGGVPRPQRVPGKP